MHTADNRRSPPFPLQPAIFISRSSGATLVTTCWLQICLDEDLSTRKLAYDKGFIADLAPSEPMNVVRQPTAK